MIFGIKKKAFNTFGRKAFKYGTFGLKQGGKIAGLAGTLTAQPELVAFGAGATALGEGLEKL
jgi:hypothetical protein